MQLAPASRQRVWMDRGYKRFAYRCLPLLIANQSGWVILNSDTFRVSWDGGNHQSSLTIVYLDELPPNPAASTFGYGILTFSIPFLFRTPQGYNLLVRGPANLPKDGISPLEGVVETDWAVETFTMNWKFTRADHVVSFDKGEPICMLVPQRRGELERFRPRIEPLHRQPELEREYRQWAESRRCFRAHLRKMRPEAAASLWQKHYFHGASPGTARAQEHQVKLDLRPFEGPGDVHE